MLIQKTPKLPAAVASNSLITVAPNFISTLQARLPNATTLSPSAKRSMSHVLTRHLADPAKVTQLDVACHLWMCGAISLVEKSDSIRIQHIAFKPCTDIIPNIDKANCLITDSASHYMEIYGTFGISTITEDDFGRAIGTSINLQTILHPVTNNLHNDTCLTILPLPLYAALIAMKYPTSSPTIYVDCTSAQTPDEITYSKEDIIALLATGKRLLEITLTSHNFDGVVIDNFIPFGIHDLSHAAGFASSMAVDERSWRVLYQFYQLIRTRQINLDKIDASAARELLETITSILSDGDTFTLQETLEEIDYQLHELNLSAEEIANIKYSLTQAQTS